MTNKEKMIAGQDYTCIDEELEKDRIRANRLCKQYNELDPEDQEQKDKILRELFQTDETCIIEPTFFATYGYNISFGKHFFMNHHCLIIDNAPVTFGDHVMLGPGVHLYTAQHPLEARKRSALIEKASPIKVGSHVWIGGRAVICPGVTIGNGVVVGAGSVVTKNVPDNVVVAGNPAKIIRTIDNEDLEL